MMFAIRFDVILIPQSAVMCVNKIYEFSWWMPDSLYRSADIRSHVERCCKVCNNEIRYSWYSNIASYRHNQHILFIRSFNILIIQNWVTIP